MNLKIQHRSFDLPPAIQRLIEKKAQKVQKMLPTFSEDKLDLHVTLEKLARGSQYQVSLLLTLPQTAIRVDQLADNPAGSIQTAFDELLRKIKKFKSQLSREKFWQRQPQYSPPVGTENVREMENIINQNLDKIQNYVRRELYHRSLTENIPPGLIQPEALVDEIFVLMTSQEKTRPSSIAFEQWMYQVAREQIDKRMDDLDRDSARIDEPPAEEELQWEDEALNFYQPDEALRLEDVLKDDRTSNPEALMELEEAEDRLHKAIARLPRKIRESFVLSVLEGFDPYDVGMITGKDASKVEKDIEDARRKLRDQLKGGMF
jgi:ribosomal subunit interface protein